MMKKSEDNQQLITLKIDKLVHGGSGLAKHEGKACFIDGVLPGETVRAQITGERSQYFNASLHDILEPSPARIQPACPVAGLCGGCQWQHLAYGEQLACKKAIVADCLMRIGKLHHIDPLSPVASPLEIRYRTRAALKISGGRSPGIGFFQKQTHSVVVVPDCLLIEHGLTQALLVCCELLKKNSRIAADYTGLELLAVASSPLVLGLWHGRTLNIKMKFAVQTATGMVENQYPPMSETVADLVFLRDTENFYQVNRLQNQAMIKKVLEFLAPVAGGDVLDLFCGCGNFSLFLAKNNARVTGIDSNKACILEARSNARMNGIAGARFLTGTIEKLTAGDLASRYDGVLINPPRTGCEARTLHLIVQRKPSIIVYVSCNPSTLARDLRLLSDAGYAVDEVQPFDMFPQTYHIETVVKLSRQEKVAR
jgi:23S rRNA (uracil1939-C5)-methyltransferase